MRSWCRTANRGGETGLALSNVSETDVNESAVGGVAVLSLVRHQIHVHNCRARPVGPRPYRQLGSR